MRPISRLWVLLIVLSLVLGGLAGCGKKAPETIKIGIFSPTTGFAAADGTSALHAAELAVKFINDAGGINGKKIELIHYDD
ncbi:MAG: branched-chain amino acid ABC transporter substrate-binding protein, partial [Chloroflexi bacterium]